MPQDIKVIPFRIYNPIWNPLSAAGVANGATTPVLNSGLAFYFYIYRMIIQASIAGQYVLEYTSGTDILIFNLAANVPFTIDFTDYGMEIDTTSVGVRILNNSGAASDIISNTLYDSQTIHT